MASNRKLPIIAIAIFEKINRILGALIIFSSTVLFSFI